MVNLYDRVRYPALPFAHTHPTAIGVFARLFGRPFVPFDRSRVLEIGCGDGVNLLNMALGAPNAEFVGVDLAERPIERAREAASACGCGNVDFRALDLLEIDASFGRFDYIVAHGVYAWVPAPVREGLMRVVGERLSADGLALISYNALPGARLREALRDMMLWASAGIDEPEAKLNAARALLGELVASWSDDQPDERALKAEAQRVLKRDPATVFHDEIAPVFAPQLLSDMVALAARFGLDYLCDAQPNLSEDAFFPSADFAPLRAKAGGNWARFEQMADFRVLRSFRHSIFCRGRADRRRDPARLRGLWACADLKVVAADPAAPDGATFETERGLKLKTNDAKLVELLLALAKAYPLAAPLDAAAADADLAEHALRLFLRQVTPFYTAQLPLDATPGDRPVVSPLARLQIARGETNLATLRHLPLVVEDAETRALALLIDGRRSRDDLARAIASRDNVSVEAGAARLREALAGLAKVGLLAG